MAQTTKVERNMVIYPTSTTSPQYEAAWLDEQGVMQKKRISSYTVLTRFRQKHPQHSFLPSRPSDVQKVLEALDEPKNS